ncbi:D-alanyl-D-alanine carboxypeptidase (penicillin-binding protein 5/6) [Alkalispirochaeta americana]|uniref:serine-type D-Ala-D-Ala carboxypeptidase n=1 Tax=Alkalispirochaeta americana TaxID=159291 RepID=A0A1N6QWZ5_9SPIO|nr:D-alanyl-D-alanine carboxypeptidase family protein [Alkalispirochaeta americana]SIQ21087.1 D-alanyl-D-alanine carboxypeptidase (penicillin-binding protein 5/6) [Alkalispirochaeta americana]
MISSRRIFIEPEESSKERSLEREKRSLERMSLFSRGFFRTLLFSLALSLVPWPALADETGKADRLKDVVLSTRSSGEETAAERFSVPPPIVEYAPVVAIMDYTTGTILYEKGLDNEWVPASVTKLVTVYTALEASRRGAFPLDEALPVHPEAYARAMPPRSSLMFLGPDQRVNGWDLLRGLAVSSGNDAAVEVALRVAGSVSAFAGEMNNTVHSLGLKRLYFEEPSGLSPGNRITAREIAYFTRILIERWPESLPQLFSMQSFAYPEAKHFPGGRLQGNTIVQYNRNTLLRDYPGVDGMKTGYTSAAGYNVVATARRGDQRLIAVVLGVAGPTHLEGGRRRSSDAISLFDWAFSSFQTVSLTLPPPQEVPIWGGKERYGTVAATQNLSVVIPAGTESLLRGEVEVPDSFWAPQDRASPAGMVRYRLGTEPLLEVPLWFTQPIEAGGVLRRGWDRLRWWFSRLALRIAS